MGEHLTPDDPPDVSHISLNALSGMPTPETFRIYGTTDYASLTMRFTYLGQPSTLNADVPLCPSPASTQQLKRIAQTHGIAALYQLTHTPTRTTITLWTPPQL